MVDFKSRWLDWEPNTPKYRPDRTDKSPSVSFGSPVVKHISPEIPDRERLAYEVRDTQLVAECRAKAVELQAWLTDHCDEHMKTEPFGMPEWIATMANFLVVERSQLRNVFGYVGCIHDSGSCPIDAPVNCTACEGKTQ